MSTSTAKPRLRIWRGLLAAVLVEVALVVPTFVRVVTTGVSTQELNPAIPVMALILFIIAGYWCGRGTSAPVLNGFIAGLWGVLLYLALSLCLSSAVADYDLEKSVSPAYLLAHGLKVVGGVIGGTLAARKAGRPS